MKLKKKKDHSFLKCIKNKKELRIKLEKGISMDKIFMAISLFLMYSFLGWIMESIYCMIIDKKFVNRGFMIGPVCPIYGVGCLLILIFLQNLPFYLNSHFYYIYDLLVII